MKLHFTLENWEIVFCNCLSSTLLSVITTTESSGSDIFGNKWETIRPGRYQQVYSLKEIEIPQEIASFDHFLRDEDIPQEVKGAKLQNLANFLAVIRDPVFQENFVITPRNQQDTSTPTQ